MPGCQITNWVEGVEGVKRLTPKDVEKYYKRYKTYLGTKTTETFVDSCISVYTRVVGTFLTIKDIEALQNDLKKDYIITKELSTLVGSLAFEIWVAAHGSQHGAHHNETYRFQCWEPCWACWAPCWARCCRHWALVNIWVVFYNGCQHTTTQVTTQQVTHRARKRPPAPMSWTMHSSTLSWPVTSRRNSTLRTRRSSQLRFRYKNVIINGTFTQLFRCYILHVC